MPYFNWYGLKEWDLAGSLLLNISNISSVRLISGHYSYDPGTCPVNKVIQVVELQKSFNPLCLFWPGYYLEGFLTSPAR